MFSDRTRWDLAPNRLSRAVAARRQRSLDVLDLTTSNPTAVGLPEVHGLLELLADPAVRRYEPEPAGLPRAREAAAMDFSRRGGAVDPGHVVLTASTSEAYGWLFKLLADDGDEVLVPQPSYPLFEFLARAEGVRIVPYPLAWDGRWHLHASALDERIGPRTRAIVVVNPNNPTGSYLKRDEAHLLRQVCRERRLAIVSDEVFADYALGSDAERVSTLAGDTDVLTFSLGGLSKTCALPQLKLGWIAVSGPTGAREEALRRLEVVADTYLSVSAPVQHAAPRLLASAPQIQAPILARVTANDARLRKALAGSAASALHTEGGWSAVVRLPAVLPEEDLVLRLLERGVLVHPGFFFDFPTEAFVVISLLPPPATFEPALEKLRRFVEDVAKPPLAS